MDRKLKAQLFLGYLLYTQTKGRELIRKGENPTKVIKFKSYLTEELNYTEEEAEQIQHIMCADAITRKEDERKDKNRK